MMADDDTDDTQPPQPASASRGHHPGARGLLSGADPGAAGDKKSDRRKTTVIVILTAVGVAIAYLTLRKSGTSSSSGGAGTSGSSANDGSLYPDSSSDGSSDGSVDGSGSDGLAQQLSLLSGQVSALAGSIPASTSTVTTSVASPHFQYKAGSHYLFDRQNGAHYQIQGNGALFQVNRQQWQEILGLDPNAQKDTRAYGTAPAPVRTPAEQKQAAAHKKATAPKKK